MDHSQNPKVIQTHHLPPDCVMSGGNDGDESSRIHSISWSGENDAIAFVCSRGPETADLVNSVCILSTDGDLNCWDQAKAENIYRVSWSPVEDLIAISGVDNYDSEISVASPDGSKIQRLARGWSAEWSPDGKQIAFISPSEKDADGNYDRGIRLMDSDGSNPAWVYDPAANDEPVILLCWVRTANCRLTWSPDGRYLAFLAMNQPPYNTYNLYRLDLRSGEIIALVDPMVFNAFLQEPAWGP
jgi:Tol biopolymer transport system component